MCFLQLIGRQVSEGLLGTEKDGWLRKCGELVGLPEVSLTTTMLRKRKILPLRIAEPR